MAKNTSHIFKIQGTYFKISALYFLQHALCFSASAHNIYFRSVFGRNFCHAATIIYRASLPKPYLTPTGFVGGSSLLRFFGGGNHVVGKFVECLSHHRLFVSGDGRSAVAALAYSLNNGYFSQKGNAHFPARRLTPPFPKI